MLSVCLFSPLLAAIIPIRPNLTLTVCMSALQSLCLCAHWLLTFGCAVEQNTWLIQF